MKKAWKRVTIGDVCQIRGGGTPSKAVNRYWLGNLPWVSPKDMKFEVVEDSIDHVTKEAVEKSATTLIPKGSVLVVVRSGILARTVPMGIAGRELTINQDIKALCPDESVDSRYLFHFLSSQEDLLLSFVSRGATVHRLMTEQIRSLPLNFPCLSEQQRIVSILDEAFEGIATAKANAERNVANARELFESYRDALFNEPQSNWREACFDDLCEIKHGYAFEGENFANQGEYVLLTPGNFFEKGGYRDRGSKQKFYTGAIPLDFVLTEGDLLVAMTEQAAGLLGSPIIVPESDRFLHNQRLGLVRPKPGAVWDNQFFFHAFNTAAVRSAIHASSSGIKVRHTSPSKIGEVRVRYPTPRAEQAQIAASLFDLSDESARLVKTYEQKLTALEALKKSLLHRAFTGQL